MINWQRVFLNLRSAGVPVTRAAKQVGMSWRAATRYARGESMRDPLMLHAVRLLDLHLDTCPQLHRAEIIGTPDTHGDCGNVR